MELTPAEAADWFMEFARNLPEHIRDAERRSGQLARTNAIALSKGPYSLALLASMGHPYARRAPRPPMPAFVINAQSHLFQASWCQRDTILWSDGTLSSVINVQPYSGYLRGTRKMIERPIDTQVGNTIGPQREANLSYAILTSMPF